MLVSESIGNEAVFFGVSILCGAGLVFVYDLFRIFRRIVPHGNIWIGIEDVCYWFFSTIVVFLLLYQRNDGMMRAFSFMGMLLGGVFYLLLFSRFIIKICVRIFGTILKFFMKATGTALKPVFKTGKKVGTFLAKQLKKFYKTIKMGLCKH